MKLNGIAITAVNHKTGVIKTAHDTNEPSNYVTQQLIMLKRRQNGTCLWDHYMIIRF